MEIEESQKICNEVKNYHKGELTLKMNGSTFVPGQIYEVSINNPNYRATFEANSENDDEQIYASMERNKGVAWSLKIFDKRIENCNPFRLEEDNKNVHINTCNPSYNHVTLIIPKNYLDTYGAIGSAMAGYYEPKGEKSIPELLVIHFSTLEKNKENYRGAGCQPPI